MVQKFKYSDMECCLQARIEHLFEKSIDSKVKLPFYTHYGDVTDINNLVNLQSPDHASFLFINVMQFNYRRLLF